ncbi:DUF2147 domain-containing protein [Variovorax sp. EL159]|uniref:DUF2147 domain-containing protein n=1 Tax=unclassified Variovorax TaxID=663243 RepID=UPI000882171A|nr:DUF2147 domain-containing protein [Variovorax sp. EL159]SCX72765.1 Uncharacterized conserved protein, DUF2147 family [Variovorax sp. EL159]
MKATFVAAIVFAATSVVAVSAMAQSTPVGLWRNVDDKTGEVKAEIRIGETNGALLGRIEKSLKKDAKPDAVCDECSDDRKGKPMLGLDIIRGGKKAEGKDVWEGGKILDPENGKEYRASFTPIDGGKKLEVRGYLGPFWRTQTWNRVQ